jgi:hypothetical protein
MPKWAAITGMAIIAGITAITVTTANGVSTAAVVSHCPAAAVTLTGLRRWCRPALPRYLKMRIPFYPRTF